MTSPIESMIDAACVCLKCEKPGPPGSCGCWIKMRCPGCGKVKLIERDNDVAGDPPDATEVRIHCPDCNSGDFDAPIYVGADGKELPH